MSTARRAGAWAAATPQLGCGFIITVTPYGAATSKHDCDPCPQADSCQLFEHRLGLSEVGGAEAFGAPAVNRRVEIVGGGALAWIAPQPGETGRGAQLPDSSTLLAGDSDGPMKSRFCGFVGVSPGQQRAPK